MGPWRAAAIATELGFAIGGSLVGGIVIGLALDRRLGTAPVFFLVGLVSGLVFSGYLIYIIYRIQLQSGQNEAVSPPAGLEAPAEETDSIHDGDPR